MKCERERGRVLVREVGGVPGVREQQDGGVDQQHQRRHDPNKLVRIVGGISSLLQKTLGVLGAISAFLSSDDENRPRRAFSVLH